ncbi:MerR family transcriptional regulator [Streptomyces sp. NPDC048416]|uniref:MerR family transcriptional regulator n=1 Tax=Streptomyces sp. NPDC048416 TaxID=3365546 RepID=UPI003716C818
MWGWPVQERASGSRRGPLRTADVAKESGYSVQQVRDLERLGVIPAAPRSGNGYRSYMPAHIHALRAYRGLAAAMGPVAARQLLGELWTGTITEAASAISAVHVRLAREREEVLRAQQALRAIQGEADHPAPGPESDAMTIGQLAVALDVRPSTLRFWELEGLVSPERVTSLRARRYGLPAIGAARIVAALRGAGYGIPAVRDVMASLHRLDSLEETERVLRQRLDDIAVRAVALLRAGADLAAVVTSAERPPPTPRPGPPPTPAEDADA